MTIKLPWRQNLSPSNLVLAVLQYATAADLLGVVAVLSYGIFRGDAFSLFLVVAVLGPLGLLLTAGRWFVEASLVRAKALRLARMLDDAAAHLDPHPREATEYDIGVDEDVLQVVNNGVLSPSLHVIGNLLVFAKRMVISENLGGGVGGWSHDYSSLSIPATLATRTRIVADAIRHSDSVLAFEALGDLLSLPLIEHRSVLSSSELGDDDFAVACREVGTLLRQRRLLDAKQASERLLTDLKERASNNAERIRWHALIGYWLSERLRLLGGSSQPIASALWVGPSKLLAAQIDAALDAYANRDFGTVAEVVNESFNSRSRVPRMVLR